MAPIELLSDQPAALMCLLTEHFVQMDFPSFCHSFQAASQTGVISSCSGLPVNTETNQLKLALLKEPAEKLQEPLMFLPGLI